MPIDANSTIGLHLYIDSYKNLSIPLIIEYSVGKLFKRYLIL